MKNVLLKIIDNDPTYNKSATRYLYRNYPDLWEQILKATEFLPNGAKPKQRIWHVINEVWAVPKCPIDGVDLKWWENRYLTTSSPTAKIKLQRQRGDFANGYTPEINEKRRQGNLAAVKKGRKYRSKETYTELQKERSVFTCIERYGVKNGGQSLASRNKVSEARIRNGATPKHLRSLRRIYYDTVWKYTEESWKNHFDQINPDRVNRSENALDHVYSIQQGFRDCIPPYIIGHWTNLRILPLVENSIKGMRCDKSQNELFDDFFACVS